MSTLTTLTLLLESCFCTAHFHNCKLDCSDYSDYLLLTTCPTTKSTFYLLLVRLLRLLVTYYMSDYSDYLLLTQVLYSIEGKEGVGDWQLKCFFVSFSI